VTRRQLGLTKFATRVDADRLMEHEISRGLDVRVDRQTDCLAEIMKFRGRWMLKLADRMDPSLRADVTFHEIGHRYTHSGMTAICSPAYHWWWRARDEIYAYLWCAHFRLPTGPFEALVRKRPSWEDLVAECQAPEGLLALKLDMMGRRLAAQPEAPELELLCRPPLATKALRVELKPENSFQWSISVTRRATGERWIWKRAADYRRLLAGYEEISWDLVGWSEERFWRRWRERLQPVLDPYKHVLWSNPRHPAGRNR